MDRAWDGRPTGRFGTRGTLENGKRSGLCPTRAREADEVDEGWYGIFMQPPRFLNGVFSRSQLTTIKANHIFPIPEGQPAFYGRAFCVHPITRHNHRSEWI